MSALHDPAPTDVAPPRHLFGGGDARLLDAACAGSEEAFAAIVRRYERPLHGYAAKLLRGSGHDPEDVIQDVFLSAHAALTSDGARVLALKPWLYRMTRNRVIDMLRRRRADLSLDAEHAAEPVAAPSADPAHAAGRRDALRVVLADVAELPESQRDALLMRELDGLSHAKVAAELGVTPEATRMLVVRARDNLVKAAAAREASCVDIRADLAGAQDARRRPSEHARRHVRGCAACRAYRHGLHQVQRRVALMHPGPALLSLLGLGKLTGAGVFAGSGKTTATIATAAAVVAAGAAGVVVIRPATLNAGDPSPAVIPGSKSFYGHQIKRGAPLPGGTTLVDARLRLPPVDRVRSKAVDLTCPPGYGAQATVPREPLHGPLAGERREGGPAFYGQQSIRWRVFWRPLSPPRTVVARIGLLCKKRSKSPG